jgi:signal transduction histidine kinase
MKVKNRLSLQFTLLFAVLLFSAFSGIYIFIQEYRTRSFFNKLDDRAITIAEFYLAQDNLSAKKFNEVMQKFQQSLSGESVGIFNDQFKPQFVPDNSIKWKRSFLEKIQPGKVVHLIEGTKQTTGIYYVDNSGDFYIVVSASDEIGHRSMQELRLIIILVFIISLFITFFLGRIFARISLSPIVKLTNNLRMIRSTDLHKRLDTNPGRTDEIDNLSTSINQLLEHLEQSFDSQKSFVANASHELRTPLTAILGEAETTLMSDRSREQYKATLRGIIDSVLQLNQIINSLMELMQTNLNVQDFQSIRLDELAWEIADEVIERYGKDRVKVTYNLPDDPSKLVIHGNRRLLFIAISNILKNALKFSEGKVVTFEVSFNSPEVIMEIRDQGIGIAPDEIDKIFQPFYRAKNARGFSGFGVGLSLTNNILRLHNGKINVSSVIDHGTVFSVRLPTSN